MQHYVSNVVSILAAYKYNFVNNEFKVFVILTIKPRKPTAMQILTEETYRRFNEG